MARNVGLKIPYLEVWKRVKKVTNWERESQLAKFLEVQAGTVSGAKTRNSFPIQWAYKVAQHFHCSTDWLMSGGDSTEKTGQTTPPLATLCEQSSQAEDTQGIIHDNMPSDKLGLGESVELLAKIYTSGNPVLIRAIAANLHAFSEAIDNKILAVNMKRRMGEMEQRMTAMEEKLAQATAAPPPKVANG